mmetsp:Transcript_140903/g.245532  ORF Transcript_140903/g.245532 Transcript_140903/m.245532 type:complete len:808 (-) Transcript_140903:1914-4337(-)
MSADALCRRTTDKLLGLFKARGPDMDVEVYTTVQDALSHAYECVRAPTKLASSFFSSKESIDQQDESEVRIRELEVEVQNTALERDFIVAKLRRWAGQWSAQRKAYITDIIQLKQQLFKYQNVSNYNHENDPYKLMDADLFKFEDDILDWDEPKADVGQSTKDEVLIMGLRKEILLQKAKCEETTRQLKGALEEAAKEVEAVQVRLGTQLTGKVRRIMELEALNAELLEQNKFLSEANHTLKTQILVLETEQARMKENVMRLEDDLDKKTHELHQQQQRLAQQPTGIRGTDHEGHSALNEARRKVQEWDVVSPTSPEKPHVPDQSTASGPRPRSRSAGKMHKTLRGSNASVEVPSIHDESAQVVEGQVLKGSSASAVQTLESALVRLVPEMKYQLNLLGRDGIRTKLRSLIQKHSGLHLKAVREQPDEWLIKTAFAMKASDLRAEAAATCGKKKRHADAAARQQVTKAAEYQIALGRWSVADDPEWQDGTAAGPTQDHWRCTQCKLQNEFQVAICGSCKAPRQQENNQQVPTLTYQPLQAGPMVVPKNTLTEDGQETVGISDLPSQSLVGPSSAVGSSHNAMNTVTRPRTPPQCRWQTTSGSDSWAITQVHQDRPMWTHDPKTGATCMTAMPPDRARGDVANRSGFVQSVKGIRQHMAAPRASDLPGQLQDVPSTYTAASSMGYSAVSPSSAHSAPFVGADTGANVQYVQIATAATLHVREPGELANRPVGTHSPTLTAVPAPQPPQQPTRCTGIEDDCSLATARSAARRSRPSSASSRASGRPTSLQRLALPVTNIPASSSLPAQA